MSSRYGDDAQLFRKAQLSDALRGWSAEAVQRVAVIEVVTLLRTEPAVLAADLAREERLDPLVLRVDQVTVEGPREVRIDVSGDARFGHRFDGGSVIATGREVTFCVPFEGDPTLWGLQPSTYSLAPTRAVVGSWRSAW